MRISPHVLNMATTTTTTVPIAFSPNVEFFVHYDDLNLFLAKYKDGEAYLKDTKMRENSTWGTELEIIATATMAKRDVIVYNHTGYLRYQNPFAQKQTIECFFIDNRAGGHFNVILEI